VLIVWKAGTRFSEDELHDILTISQGVFDEEEAEIPVGVEDVRMDKIANKLLGAKKIKKRAVGRKKAWKKHAVRNCHQARWARVKSCDVIIEVEGPRYWSQNTSRQETSFSNRGIAI
jgi:hypothetical protein